MALQIENGLLEEFHDEIREKLQQRMSKLRPHVNVVPINGQYLYLDDVGGADFVLNNEAYAETNYTNEVTYARRRLSTNRYLCDRPVDLNIHMEMSAKEDYLAKLASSIAAGAARQVERVLLASIEANAEDASGNSISFATDGGISIDATSGFTFAQFMAAKRQLMQQGFGIDEDTGILFLCSEQERIILEQETEVSSADFAPGFGVVKDSNGNLKRLRGVDLITYPSAPQYSDAMLSVASNVRTNYFINTKGQMGHKAAVTVGIQKDFRLEMVEAKETRHDTLLLKGSIKLGATREANPGAIKMTTTVTT